MKNKSFILGVLIMILQLNNSLYGSKAYSHDYSDNLNMSLILVDSNSFVVRFQYSDGDIGLVNYALCGSYNYENDTIHFHDNMYGFDLLGKIFWTQYPTKVEYFKFISDYPFLQGINFELDDYDLSSEELESFSGFKDQHRIDKELRLFGNTAKHFTIRIGKYCANFFKDDDLCLELRQDHSFSYYFLDKIMMNGTWNKTRNIITLKDVLSLNKYFLAITGNNQIAAIFLPFFGGEELEYRTFK